jgi:CHAD domain-containing protein
LGDCAYQAIQKHFKKSVKYEKDVLADKDPEAIHQMRVGIRRLRTALQVFEPVLELPKADSSKQIRKIAHCLGAVRDLDVLKTRLEERYRPDLQGKEQKRLSRVLDRLERQRQQDFAEMERTLKGKRYRQFKQSLNDWLDDPQGGAIATLPILPALPDLLLPLISNLLLHPGWLVGTQYISGEVLVSEHPSTETVKKWLDRQSETLHDLRKQIKQVRYQTEFFTEFYGSSYEQQTEDLQAVQEVLGQIQDYAVLKAFLRTTLKASWQQDLPTLAQRLEHEQISLWQTWQPIQQRYLSINFRQHLRELVMTPHPAQARQL